MYSVSTPAIERVVPGVLLPRGELDASDYQRQSHKKPNPRRLTQQENAKGDCRDWIEGEKHGHPRGHYVALRVGIASGIDVFGPFRTEADAHTWVRENEEGENFDRFGQAKTPDGVSWVVQWLDVPVKYER